MEQFVITDGEKFIRKLESGKYGFTKNIAQAQIFSCRAANNILLSSIRKKDRVGLGVAEVVNGFIGKITIPSRIDNGMLFTKNSSDELNETEFERNFQAFKQYAARRLEKVTKMHEAIEGCQQDILHYIEFNDLNCCDGYKAYKSLKDVRQLRRKLRNEYKAASNFVMRYSATINVNKQQKNQYKLRQLMSLSKEKCSDLLKQEIDKIADEYISSDIHSDNIKNRYV